ncbi:MAG: aminopeptidase P family N-terminal domain-containing protein [Verrucomicrobiales bacterium]|nr:aminopeptidase P family N-terminal domain-containing protein [Verrucomicrobiales bacterium]
MFEITQIPIPDFGAPEEIPVLPPRLYRDRCRRVLERLREAGLDALVVYADREHSANLSYCTGFDPRFEEALFVLTSDGQATLCLGNECLNVVSALPVSTDILLCQDFSLMGQDRSKSWDLTPLLAKAGLRRGMRCGIAGWKTLEAGRLEVPFYIVDLISQRCGRPPTNANDLFMHPQRGLRIVNEPEQIAQFEYAATRTSNSILKLLRAIEPGKRCFELAAHFDGGGLPDSCHPMVSCGRRIPNGMASPGNTRVVEGHFLTSAFGVWGALTCRAGWLTAHPEVFAKGTGRAVWPIIENYLTVTRAWYAAVSVDASAGDVWAQTDAARQDGLYTLCVNPGHYLHLDEWVSSPFWKDSPVALPSGCALQADIIPVPRKGTASINMEDGIVLADARLRSQLERRYPALHQRCEARRRFMIEVLGYALSPDILPLSNIPGAYFPCLLDTTWVCRHRRS